LGENAIHNGTIDRIHFFGLSLGDILLYLPDGQRLLKEKKREQLGDASVAAAAQSADKEHPDLTDLINEILRLGVLFGQART